MTATTERAPSVDSGAPAVLVQVAVLAPIPHPLTYLVPPGMVVPRPGARVLCPLGNREVTGVVLPSPAAPSQAAGLRPLSEVLDEEPLWSRDLLETVQFCSDYYLAPIGEVARAALPPGLAPKTTRQWRITAAGRLALGAPEAAGLNGPELEVLRLVDDKPRAPQALQKAAGVGPGRLARMAARGLVEDEREVKGQAAAQVDLVWSARTGPGLPALPARAPALAAIDAYLRAKGATAHEELVARFPQALKHLKRLEKLARIACDERARALADPYASFPTPRAPDPASLTGEQRAAIDALCRAVDSATFGAFLLEGVTGSGKTEVYLHAIAHARALGKTALVLVPEIALTPSLAARFRGRVPGGVAVLHSGLSASERRAAYDAARHGRVGAVLGARSAIYAPLWNVGLIVVDEEHDGSYKQDESPRYHGRDLALYRARAASAACVLGSATPSLESVHGVHGGRLERLCLSARPGARPMPRVELVDLRRRTAPSNAIKRNTEAPLTVGAKVPILSTPLVDALQQTLDRHEQALIFLNRRGYSSAVLCVDCGLTLSCPHCAVSLTHHAPRRSLAVEEKRPAGILRCHYCDHEQPVPELCPSCAGLSLWPLGLGIQRVEAELAARFPTARIGRLDRDSVRAKGSLERTLHAFADGKLDVLVGTQMLAKGHDYPGVTLVGVVAADVGLRLPDWRAAERTLQLLIQVGGRAGRGDIPGRVLIQTYCPDHDALVCAARHDVRGFCARELQLRAELGYPPYSRLCLVRAEGRHEQQAVSLAARAALILRRAAERFGDQVSVLGPAPAPLARLREIWRYQVLVKAVNHHARSSVLSVLRRELANPPAGTRLILDVDPGAVL